MVKEESSLARKNTTRKRLREAKKTYKSIKRKLKKIEALEDFIESGSEKEEEEEEEDKEKEEEKKEEEREGEEEEEEDDQHPKLKTLQETHSKISIILVNHFEKLTNILMKEVFCHKNHIYDESKLNIIGFCLDRTLFKEAYETYLSKSIGGCIPRLQRIKKLKNLSESLSKLKTQSSPKTLAMGYMIHKNTIALITKVLKRLKASYKHDDVIKEIEDLHLETIIDLSNIKYPAYPNHEICEDFHQCLKEIHIIGYLLNHPKFK